MIDEESLRQIAHFGFTADEFNEDACDMIKKVIEHAMGELEKGLIAKFKDVPPETIKKQVEELQNLYLQKAEAPMIKFQETVKEIFTLPPDVRVPGYDEDVFDEQVDDEQVIKDKLESLQKEIATLEDTFMQKCKFLTHLKAQKAKLESVQHLCEPNIAMLEILKEDAKDGKTCEELFETLEACYQHLVKVQASTSDDPMNKPAVDKYNMFGKKK